MQEQVACCKKEKWYHWHRFPILPKFKYRKADDWNAADFSISWLNIRIWSLMSPDIGLEFATQDTDIHISVRIPYIKIVIYLMWFPWSWHQKAWRLGKRGRG